MARNILSVSLIALSVLALLSFVAGGAVKIQQTKYDGDQDITFYRPAKNGKEVAAPLVFKTDGNGKLKGDTTFRMRKSATPGTGLDFDRPTVSRYHRRRGLALMVFSVRLWVSFQQTGISKSHLRSSKESSISFHAARRENLVFG